VEALGIYLDGSELKLSHLRKTKDSIELLSCEKVLLANEKEQKVFEEETPATGFVDVLDNLNEFEMAAGEEPEPANADITILYNTLARYPGKNLNVAVNILESEISFVNVPREELGSKNNVRKAVKDQLRKICPDITDANFDYIPANGKEHTAFYHDGELSLLKKVLEIKETTRGRFVISHVEEQDGINVLVYVGRRFSRILFFKDGQFIRFSRIINKGYQSADLFSSMYAKLLFELHSLEEDDIRNIYTAGDGDLAELNVFLRDKLPECSVSVLPAGKLFPSVHEKNSDIEPEKYAIPLAMAWKALSPKDGSIIDANFLPAAVRKQQGAFRFAWHGYAAMIILFCLTLLCVYRWFDLHERMDTADFETGLINTALANEQSIADRIVEMDNEISRYESVITLTDSLNAEGQMYSDVLRYLGKAAASLNSIWIHELNLREDGFRAAGMSLYRSRIHNLADSTGSAVIENMIRQKIRDRTIYRYNISGNPWSFLSKSKGEVVCKGLQAASSEIKPDDKIMQR